MTGYAEKIFTCCDHDFLLKIMGINSRFLDITIHMPDFLDTERMEMEKIIKQYITRGKLVVKILAVASEHTKRQNLAHIQSTLNYLSKLDTKQLAGINVNFDISNAVFGYTSFIEQKELILNNNDKKALVNTLQKALLELMKTRKREGVKTEQYIKDRLDTIQKKLEKIKVNKEREKKNKREKLEQAGILNEEDLSNFLIRLDTSEEIERLFAHVEYFYEILKKRSQAKGKKLDFLAQEMLRELTTLSSKTQEHKIIHNIIILKEEVEKIREQLRNIE